MYDRFTELLQVKHIEYPLPVVVKNPKIVRFVQILHDLREMATVTVLQIFLWDLIGEELFDPLGLEFLEKHLVCGAVMGRHYEQGATGCH